MKILNIEIACMSETFNGTFIDQLIPEYNNKLVFTQQGKELYLELLQNFVDQGFTHITFPDGRFDQPEQPQPIQDFIKDCEQNYYLEE
jgi:glutathione peroxidase-family protein